MTDRPSIPVLPLELLDGPRALYLSIDNAAEGFSRMMSTALEGVTAELAAVGQKLAGMGTVWSEPLRGFSDMARALEVVALDRPEITDAFRRMNEEMAATGERLRATARALADIAAEERETRRRVYFAVLAYLRKRSAERAELVAGELLDVVRAALSTPEGCARARHSHRRRTRQRTHLSPLATSHASNAPPRAALRLGRDWPMGDET